MQIKCSTKFRDGTDTFEKDDIRTVDDERGAYFIEQGWAAEVGADALPLDAGDVTLNIHSSTHATGDSNG